ncbi:ArnT family glycosyltransferase [Sulfurimonas sp.]
MNLTAKEHRPFLFFISFVALLRLLLAPTVGLGVDEAHYLLYAKNLALSYFDHPPLVGWVQYIFISIFGDGEFGARVFAIIVGFVVSIFIYRLIYAIENNATQATLATLGLYASFLFNALFLMLLPDTLLFLLIVPIIFTVLEIEKSDTLKAWLTLGLLLGLAGLSKYTAVLFIVPIIFYFVIKKRVDLFLNLKLLLSATFALIIIAPVIIWNINNEWISFTYQSQHVVGENSIHWSAFFKSFGAQFGAYNPFLVPLAFYGLYKSLQSKNNVLFLSALFGLVLISFFTYASLYKTALPHWSALFYMLFIPIGIYYMLNISKKYVLFALAFGLTLSALAYGELAFKIIPFDDYKSPHRDIYAWPKIMKEANKFIKNRDKDALGVTNWTLASRAIYYNQAYKSQLYLLDKRYDQFDFWQKESPIGKNIIIINTHFFKKDIQKYMKCDKIETLEKFDIKLHNHKVNTIKLTKCTNYQGLL